MKSGPMPQPLSRTATSTQLSRQLLVSSMSPPGAVYFAALLSRFAITWTTRVRSPATWPGASRTKTLCCRLSSNGRTCSKAAFATSVTSKLLMCRLITPE
jgi:hypothetical protein